MRFIMLVKSAENSGAPPNELLDAIAKLSSEAVKAGTMLASGGLAPTAMGKRVRLSQGVASMSPRRGGGASGLTLQVNTPSSRN